MKHNRLLAWWQLLRIGNVFTAISNILAGFLLVQGAWQPRFPLFALMGASALLYAAGMVLNDAFDADLDARERPERPIPSGRIARAVAFQVGFALLAAGIGCAWLASWKTASLVPGILGSLLAVAIVGYDAKLKSTDLGPSSMGFCRYLNVLLGASVADQLFAEPAAWVYAAVVGMYTIGLTLFARSENAATISKEQRLSRFFLIGAFLLLGTMPAILSNYFEHLELPILWYGAMLLLLLPILRNESLAFASPGPNSFRRHVSLLLLGFIFLDALACYAAMGWPTGLILLTLVLPTKIAKHWAPMT